MLQACKKGGVYYVKYNTMHSRHVFSTAALCIQFVQMLQYYADGYSDVRFSKVTVINDRAAPVRAHILSYCILPAEYHLLACQIAPDGLYQCIKRVHEAITRYANAMFKESGRLFDAKKGVISQVNVYDVEAIAEDIHSLPAFFYSREYRNNWRRYPWSSYHNDRISKSRARFIQSAQEKVLSI